MPAGKSTIYISTWTAATEEALKPISDVLPSNKVAELLPWNEDLNNK